MDAIATNVNQPRMLSVAGFVAAATAITGLITARTAVMAMADEVRHVSRRNLAGAAPRSPPSTRWATRTTARCNARRRRSERAAPESARHPCRKMRRAMLRVRPTAPSHL